MTLTPVQTFIIMSMVAIATMITRFLPFFIFKNVKSNNSIINYLGQVLPYAAIGMLVVYCLRNVNFTSSDYGLPEAISIISIVMLHNWKENTLLSIGLGTLIYMFLVQMVFI
ncbi:MAG TPA: AzlD domain-containing protein [Tissierellaceae bacterium]|jgi:branched-subunit amino acid transport protein AzlD|nr:AzlD domain-containing protein [Tissierellaceae bacterium]